MHGQKQRHDVSKLRPQKGGLMRRGPLVTQRTCGNGAGRGAHSFFILVQGRISRSWRSKAARGHQGEGGRGGKRCAEGKSKGCSGTNVRLLGPEKRQAGREAGRPAGRGNCAWGWHQNKRGREGAEKGEDSSRLLRKTRALAWALPERCAKVGVSSRDGCSTGYLKKKGMRKLRQ